MLNFAKEAIVCIRRITHPKRYNRGNTHGFHEFYALFFAKKQI